VRVPQAVRMHPLINAGFRRPPPEHGADIADRDRAAPQRAEQRRRGPRVQPQIGLPTSPAVDQAEGRGIEADRAWLMAFSVVDAQRAALVVEVARMERQRLADAQAAAVEYRDQDGVSGAPTGARREHWSISDRTSVGVRMWRGRFPGILQEYIGLFYKVQRISQALRIRKAKINVYRAGLPPGTRQEIRFRAFFEKFGGTKKALQGGAYPRLLEKTTDFVTNAVALPQSVASARLSTA